MNVYLESLGCARNLVDSEVMLGHLAKADWKIISDPSDADLIVINTCSFIESAVDESIETILTLSEYKKSGKCKHLVVAGCLPERFREDIAPELEEVDLFIGTGAADKIAEAVDKIVDYGENNCILPDPNDVSPIKADLPRILTSPDIAYIKIAEGCDRHCTYCIIPKLRGKYRSRPEDDILKEAGKLVGSGVKELILVAESTTDYGQTGGDSTDSLENVLKSISLIDGDFRLRMLYGFPDTLEDSVIKIIGDNDKICTYFDIPIQHASNNILKKMGRNYTREELYELYDKIRELVPDASLRTTLITGFPGETEEDFNELMEFVEDIEFDHLGVFVYSDSEDLPSHKLKNHVPEDVAQKRHDAIMELQAKISQKNNFRHKNNTYKVLIEENPDEGLYLGRTEFQAPDVDGVTFVYSENLTIGSFVDVKITDAYEYDLAGEVI